MSDIDPLDYFTEEQIIQLLKGINELRVSKKDGMSHLEAYDVRAHLTRIFGFGRWSETSLDLTMLYEQSKEEGQSVRWRAAYRATQRLTIHAPSGLLVSTYDGSAAGTNFGWLPDTKRDETHDMAIKTAQSQALKRCAINLGDQFGLSLYKKGSLSPTVQRVLFGMPDGGDGSDVQSHITEQLPPETDPDEKGEQPARPRPVGELDAEYARAHGVSVEEARRVRLDAQAATRDALGTDSSGKVRREERGRVTRTQGAPVEPDPWAVADPDGQGTIDI
jgi:hypothetical protein